MEEATINFLYESNLFLDILLVLILVAVISKPKLFIALATAMMLLRPNERMDFSVPFMQLILPVLFIYAIIQVANLKNHLLHDINKTLYYFILIIVIQTILFNREDIIRNIFFIIPGLLLYIAILCYVKDVNDMNILSGAIIISCFLICIEPIYYHYMEAPGSLRWNIFHSYKIGRLQAWGMWANANETSYLACVGVANVLILTTTFRNFLWQIVSFALIAFYVLVIYLTASRAGIATLLIVFIPVAVFSRAKFIRFLVLVLCGSVVLLSYFLSPQREDAESSTEARYDLRYSARQVFKEHPLVGVGFLKARDNLGGTPVHNTYLQAFVETGIIGGFVIIAYIVKLVVILIRNILNKQPSKGQLFISGYLLSSIFYFYWGNQLLSTLFFLVTAQVTTVLAMQYNEASSCVTAQS